MGVSKIWFALFAVLCWSRTDGESHSPTCARISHAVSTGTDLRTVFCLILKDNGPVTTGSNITLNATVTNDEGLCLVGDKLVFKYEDDAFPKRQFQISTNDCSAIFIIPTEVTIGPTHYSYQVEVFKSLYPFINWPIISGRGQFNVTDNINGELRLLQNNTNLSENSVKTTYVSTHLETVHKIEINAADLNYLNMNASSILVYWFVDCHYKGNTTNYTFSANYTHPDVEHEILGIIVANMTSPTKVVIDNSVTPSTSGIATTTDSTATSSTANLTVTTTESSKTDIKSYHIINSTYTSDCQQKNPLNLLLSVAPLQNFQKYGYFSRSLLPKDPVTNVKTQGNVWLQEGEMLELQLSCNGSGPFRFCNHYQQGTYNGTGNETCTWELNVYTCLMKFRHYFHEATNHTLLVIMANDVSKLVIPIGINIYKVQKHPQISVIVVPVTFSSIAVVIIVFGIAYYFQNKSRYMVEVADFDFANNSDMECKTFRERLRDAISQAINRTHDYSEYDGSEEQIGGLATPQNQKYGSMQ